MRRIKSEEIQECLAEMARRYVDARTAECIAIDQRDMVEGWLEEECRRSSNERNDDLLTPEGLAIVEDLRKKNKRRHAK